MSVFSARSRHTLLLATSEGAVVHRQVIDAAWAYSIGRSHRCDIPLEPASISRRHAVLFHHAGSWWVADTGSQRGLATEDGPCRFAPLTEERWVGLGPLVAWIVPTSNREAAADLRELPRSRRIDFSGADAGGDSSAGEEAIDPASPQPTAPLVLIEDAAGRLLRLLDPNGIDHATIGSDATCDIKLETPADARDAASAVAPLHAILYREPRAWVLVAAQGVLSRGGERYLRMRLDSSTSAVLGAYRVRLLAAERLAPEAPCAGTSTEDILRSA
jgi:hypothetical protein